MGIQSERFRSAPTKEFQCLICRDVLENPLQTPCDHCFCKECITNSLSTNPFCPVCSSTTTAVQLKPVMRVMRNLLSSFQVRCVFIGCQKWVKYEALGDHENDCEFGPANCPHAGCEFARGTHLNLQRCALKTHIMQCKFAKVGCPQGCGETLRVKDVEDHLPNCKLAPVTCECGEKMIPTLLEGHKNTTCEKLVIKCDVTGCLFSAPRGDTQKWEEHLNSAVVEHTKLLAKALQNDVQALKLAESTLSSRDAEVGAMMQQLRRHRLQNLHRAITSPHTVTWVVVDFVTKWTSDNGVVPSPCLTFSAVPNAAHRYTIQIFLSINSNDDGKLGIFVSLLRGEHGHLLEWPLSRTLTFRCINARGGDDLTKNLNCATEHEFFSVKEVPDVNYQSNMIGWPEFMVRDEVESGQFLHNGCLVVQCTLDGNLFG